MSKKIILVSLLVLVLPVVVFAEESARVEAIIFGESVEKFIEILNLILALATGYYAIKLAALSQGGSMEKTWNFLAIVAVLFVILEVVGALAGFGIVHVSGLSEIIELAFVATFVYSLRFTKNDLLKKVLGK